MLKLIGFGLLLASVSFGCKPEETKQTSNEAKLEKEEPVTDPEREETETVDGPTAGYTYTTCDQLKASTKAGGKSLESPASFEMGELITGVLDSNDPDVREEFWKIDLKKGEYLLVLEAERANGENGNIIFDVQKIDSDSLKGTRIINLNEIAYDARSAERYTSASDKSLTIKITSSHNLATYRLGFFRASDKIPVPRFTNCPETQTLTVGKKVDFEFKDIKANRSLYLVGDLEAGDYNLKADSTTTDNKSGNVGVNVYQLGEGASDADKKRIVDINEISTKASGAGRMLLAKKQKVIIEVHTSFSDNAVEFTLSKK